MTQKIVTAVVGSKLHGLDTPTSDIDRVDVVVSPLIEVLSPFTNQRPKSVANHTSYELSHFIKLLAQGNPTVLEVLWSPMIENETLAWTHLRTNRVKVLNTEGIYRAHRGYAKSQLAHIEGKEDSLRFRKACIAFIRTLAQGIDLLSMGTFDPCLTNRRPALCGDLMEWKTEMTPRDVIRFEKLSRLYLDDLDKTFEKRYFVKSPDIPWLENYIVNVYQWRGE